MYKGEMSRMVKCFLFLATLVSTACATRIVSQPKGASFQPSLYLTDTRGNGKAMALPGIGPLHQDHHVPILRTGDAAPPTPAGAIRISPRSASGTVSATAPLSTYFSDYIQPMTAVSTKMDSFPFVAPLHTATGPFMLPFLHQAALGSLQPRIFQPSVTGSTEPSASKPSPPGSFQPDLVPSPAYGSVQSPINQPGSFQSATPTAVGLFQPFTLPNMFQPVAPTQTFIGSLLQAGVWPWNIRLPTFKGTALPQQKVTEGIGQTLLANLNPHTGLLYIPQQDDQFQQRTKFYSFQPQYPYPLLKQINSVQTMQTKSTDNLKEQTPSGPSLPSTTADPLQPKNTSDSRLNMINNTSSPQQKPLVSKLPQSTNDPYRPQTQPVPTLTHTGATALGLPNPDHLSVTDPFKHILDLSLAHSLQTRAQFGQSQQINPKDKGHTRQRSDLWPTMNSKNPTQSQTPFGHAMPLPKGGQFQPANPSYHGSTTVNEIQLQPAKTTGQLESLNVKGTDQPQNTVDVNVQMTPVDPLYSQIKSNSLPPMSQDLILYDPLLSYNALNLGHPQHTSGKRKAIMQGEKNTSSGMSDSKPITVDNLISRASLTPTEPLQPQLHTEPSLPLAKNQQQGASGQWQHMSSKQGQLQMVSNSARTLTKHQFQPQNPDNLSGTSILDTPLPAGTSQSGSIKISPALDRLQPQYPYDPIWTMNAYQPQNTADPGQHLNYVVPKLVVRI